MFWGLWYAGVGEVGQCYLPPWPTGAASGAKISPQPRQALYGHWVEGYPHTHSSSTDSYKLGKDTVGTSCSPSQLTRGAIFWGLGENSLRTAVCQDFLVLANKIEVISKAPQGPAKIAESWGDVL